MKERVRSMCRDVPQHVDHDINVSRSMKVAFTFLNFLCQWQRSSHVYRHHATSRDGNEYRAFRNVGAGMHASFLVLPIFIRFCDIVIVAALATVLSKFHLSSATIMMMMSKMRNTIHGKSRVGMPNSNALQLVRAIHGRDVRHFATDALICQTHNDRTNSVTYFRHRSQMSHPATIFHSELEYTTPVLQVLRTQHS